MSFKVRLPNSAGETSDLNHAAEMYLDKYYPDWKQQGIIRVPVHSHSDWESPTGEASGAASTLSCFQSAARVQGQESKRAGLAKGSRAEADVADYVSSVLNEAKCAAMVVQRANVSQLGAKVLGQMLGSQVETAVDWHQAELADFLCVSPRFGFLLLEVKASETHGSQVKHAAKQLRKASSWLQSLLQHGLNLQCPVRRLIMLPNLPRNAYASADAAEHTDVQLLFKEDVDSQRDFLQQFLQSESCLSAEQYQMLCRMLLLTKVVARASVASLHVAEQQLSKSQSLAETLETLTTQSFLQAAFEMQQRELQKSKQCEAQEQESQIKKRPQVLTGGNGLFNLIIFLTPEQLRCMEEPHRCQTVFGYAGTGKTVLVQNKAVEILTRDSEAKVLLLLPDMLVSMYRQFFKNNLHNYEQLVASGRLLVSNVAELAQKPLSTFQGFHIFLDELSNAIELAVRSPQTLIPVLKLLLDAIKCKQDGLLIWKTEDYSQQYNMGGSQADRFVNDLRMSFSSLGVFNFLTSTLRSTVRVYEQWRDYCDSICLFAGHNVLGDSVQRRLIPLQQYTYENVVDLVSQTIGQLRQSGWRCEDIGVLIESNHLRLFGKAGNLLQLTVPKSNAEQQSELIVATSCAERYLQPDTFTVDTVSQTMSHEWPVVITVLDQFVPSTLRYLARSRCLVQLVVLEPDFGNSDQMPTKWIESRLTKEYEMFRFTTNYSRSVKLHNAIKEFSQILTGWFKRAKELQSFATLPIPWETRCKESLIRILNDFHEHNHQVLRELLQVQQQEASSQKQQEVDLLLNLNFDNLENYFAIVLLLSQLSQILQHVQSARPQFSFDPNNELKIPADWMEFDGEFEEWQQMWETEMRFNFPAGFRKNFDMSSTLSFLFS